MAQRPIGPYVIEQRLAAGGMAEVFVAKRLGPHGFFKRVALKRILPQYAKDPDFVAMFVEEARLAARLEHPNIVQVFDFGELHGELFLAMELVDGTNVNQLLRVASVRREAVPLEVALHIASQTAHALAYAHRATDEHGTALGIVHRDVSPANLLLNTSGHVKLSDFGIARVADHNHRTDDGHVRGKLGYMSPEQVLGKSLDGRSDVFTLSTVLAELLLGEPLFGTGKDLDILLRIRDVDLTVFHRAARRIPQDVQRLVALGLTREAEQRPTSQAFADAVDEVLRRRAAAQCPEKLARLLARLELIRVGGKTSMAQPAAPGARPTSLLDTTGLSTETAQVVGKLGVQAPEIYRVRLVSGEQVGPISFSRLVELITTGKVQSHTAVSKEGGEFSLAAAFPELARFVTSPALQWSDTELTRATHRGPLDGAQLLPVVHRMASQDRTGVLHLHDGIRRKKVYFVDGRPEFVASTEREELLGEYLVANGVCLRMEVDMALAMLPRYGGRLGDALVGLGILRPIQLFRAVSGQVRSRFLEAFRWRTGEWAFVPDVRIEEEVFPIANDVNELIRDAVLEAPSEDVDEALKVVSDRVLVPVDSPRTPITAYRVPEDWAALISRVRGDATVGATQLRESARFAKAEDVNRVLYFGLSCDLLRAA